MWFGQEIQALLWQAVTLVSPLCTPKVCDNDGCRTRPGLNSHSEGIKTRRLHPPPDQSLPQVMMVAAVQVLKTGSVPLPCPARLMGPVCGLSSCSAQAMLLVRHGAASQLLAAMHEPLPIPPLWQHQRVSCRAGPVHRHCCHHRLPIEHPLCHRDTLSCAAWSPH